MKALSLMQPWATLVVIGAKKFETRSWSTQYRGPLLIHASKKFPRAEWLHCQREPFLSALKSVWKDGITPSDALPTGAIIGRVNLVDCAPTEIVSAKILASIVTTPIGAPHEIEFGGYFPGRSAWQLSTPERFAEPIPAKGSLGLWEFDY